MNLSKFLSGNRQKPKLKLICFDLDNTLYDYDAAEAETEAHMANTIYADFRKKKEITPSLILNKFNEVKHAHMHHNIEPEKFSRQLWFKELLQKLDIKLSSIKLKQSAISYEKSYWKFLIPKIKLFPHTLETLQALKNQGYLTACLTDSDGDRRIKMHRITHFGLDNYLDFIITTDDTKKNKPAIENWEYLLKQTGFTAKECMMIGDHPEVDLFVPKHMGFATVWTKEHLNSDLHFNYVDHEIHDIHEVLKLMK